MGRLDELARQRLIDLRTTRGFTQARVGDAVGWTQATVSKYELGDQAADLDTLAAFAALYDVPLGDLLSDDGPPAPADARAQAFRDAYARLSAVQQDALLVMLEAAAAPKPRPSGPARRSVRRARTPTT